MDPITKAIDKTEEFLGHSPHPAIVALPLGAFVVSNVCDGLGVLTGDHRYDDAGRWSMAIGLVGAAGAVLTGVRDYGDIRPTASRATPSPRRTGWVMPWSARCSGLRGPAWLSISHPTVRRSNSAPRALWIVEFVGHTSDHLES